jgi:hypothetical protein
MKLICTYSPSHEGLLYEWFLPSLQDDYEVQSHRSDIRGQGDFLSRDWTEGVLFKANMIVEAIRQNWDDIFVYSDVDVQFFGKTRPAILQALGDRDIVCQLDAPCGTLCTGFIGIRANRHTLELWQRVLGAIREDRRDQLAFNRIVRELPELRFGYLPLSFFGTGTFSGREWLPGTPFYIPLSPRMFHANWVVGVANKIHVLREARRVVRFRTPAILLNNYRYFREFGLHHYRAVTAMVSQGR